MAFGLAGDAAARSARLRCATAPPSPDGGVIADWTARSAPAELAAPLDPSPAWSTTAFPPELVTDIVVRAAGAVEHRVIAGR